MRKIGGPDSRLFELSAQELAVVTDLLENGGLLDPIDIHSHGASGGLVRFRTPEEAALVKLKCDFPR